MFKLLSLTSAGLVLTVVACSGKSTNTHEGRAGTGAVAGRTNAGSSGEPASAGGSTAGTDTNSGSGGSTTGGTDDGGAPGEGGAGQSSGAGADASGGAGMGAGGAGGSDTGGMAGSSGSAGSGQTDLFLPPLVTSAPGDYWNTDGTLTESTADANVTVDDTEGAQTWHGFGGAFNEIGWLYLTSSEMQTQAMTLLFSATDGAAFTWGRIPIGASDYAVSRYTCDDTAADVTPNSDESNRPADDISLSLFSLARDSEALVPYIKAAQAINPGLRFWASPWTPPVWMKTGYKTQGEQPSYYDGGNMKSDAATLAAYAQYFTKFVQGYGALGIDIELVSPQQEPSFDQNYPSCLWDKTTYATFIGQHLGPAMRSLGVDVMLGTLANADKDFDTAEAALTDPTARGFLTVIGAQWGGLDEGKLAALDADLPVWATEHKGGNYPWNPSGLPPYAAAGAPNDHAYGVESWGQIRDAITRLEVTSYNAWNMVLDKAGWSIDTSREWAQDALLVADGEQVTPTPAYYVFRHVSQYAVPGATVIRATGGDAIAFKNPDGSVVAVMFNDGEAIRNYVVAIGGKKLQFSMPELGWATVKYTP